MRSIINQNLYRHSSSATDGLNNLCTIIHKLKYEGYYRAEIYIRDQYLGSFKINYDSKLELPQVNIDASVFDPIRKKTKDEELSSGMMEVGMEGYLVFHVSDHQEGLYIKLNRLTEKKEEKYFDSRRLGKGDMVVFRVIYPGEYSIEDTVSKQTMQFFIKENKEGKYPHPSKVQPFTITLNAKSFEAKKIEVMPLQAIIIKAETECVLKLELKKEKKNPKKTK